ncbi:hypothetical protein Tco_1566774, partial [Tanacetum coccineum]
VMSFASSAVTYTSVYTDFELGRVFWGADEEISEGGSPRVIVLGYDGLPIQPIAPPSPDYIPDSEEPQTPPVPQDEDEREPMFIQPHDPDYVPEPIYPEDEEDEEEEEEHLVLANSVVIVPTVELVSPPEGTEPVIPPPSTHITTTGARIIVLIQASISLPPEAEVKRLLAMPTLPPSPLTSLSPPSAGERLARIASTQALVDAVTVALPSPPLPPLPPSLYIPPPVDRMRSGRVLLLDLPEVEG